MRTLTALEGDTLDRLLYRYYGTTAGLVEQALEYNPQLANLPILPMGQLVQMPDEMPSVTLKDTLQLWI